ncbi:MAG: SMP-30/gluconolactonase/LRE family protein [Ginsengibacter sp.]
MSCSSFVIGQQVNGEKLFKSQVLLPINTFTEGVEGPAVDKDGNLYAVNFGHEGTIGKITPKGDTSLFVELPKGSVGNGIRFNSKGNMMIADYTLHNILMVDMQTKAITVYAKGPEMSQPNDIAIDKKDRLFASDPNWKANTGRIWRIDPDGKVTLLDTTPGAVNGIEVSPDNKILYVNYSKSIWAYDINKLGMIVNRREIITFPDFGMDGMRCDREGNIYVARYGKGTVAEVSPTGIVLNEVTLTGKRPTNVTFGGIDGKTVYVTLQDKGNIEAFRTDIAGREWKPASK